MIREPRNGLNDSSFISQFEAKQIYETSNISLEGPVGPKPPVVKKGCMDASWKNPTHNRNVATLPTETKNKCTAETSNDWNLMQLYFFGGGTRSIFRGFCHYIHEVYII